MVSIPWFTSVFQAGKDIPTLLQFIKGRVKPSRGTEQSWKSWGVQKRASFEDGSKITYLLQVGTIHVDSVICKVFRCKRDRDNSEDWLLWLLHTFFPLLCLIQCIVSSVFTSFFFLLLLYCNWISVNKWTWTWTWDNSIYLHFQVLRRTNKLLSSSRTFLFLFCSCCCCCYFFFNIVVSLTFLHNKCSNRFR